MFTRNETNELMAQIKTALEEVAFRNNVSISTNGARFGEDITSKIVINKIQDTKHGSFPETKESKEFRLKAKSMGLRENVLFELINTSDGALRITGYSARRPKNPMVFEIDGKKYKSPVAYIVNLVKKAKPQFAI